MLSSSPVLFDKARDLHQQGQWALAADTYRDLLRREPDHVGGHHGLGSVLMQMGDLPAAIVEFARVSELAPSNVESHVLRGQCLERLGHPADALVCFDQALALRPSARVALYHRGLVMLALQRSRDAIASFDALIALEPDHAAVIYSRANALRDEGRFDEAIAGYDRAISLQPGLSEAYRNRGMAKLIRGDFAGGLADYEYRRPSSGSKVQAIAAIPDWTGGDIAGQSLLVSDASGLGDTLQFCRYLPLLVARGVQVSFVGHPRLLRLLRSLSPSVELLPDVDGSRHFDWHCKLLSLPFLFGTTLATIPRTVPYLAADPARTAHWARRLGTNGFKVGICWQGNPARSIDAGRSIPLAAFAPLLHVPGLRLISLQKNFGLEQLSSLPAGSVETLGEDFDGGSDAFLDSAAVIENLDLVISSDTSIAHLAGALARPAWIALREIPEWRWLLEREDSPWYPSLRLFKQPVAGDWASVFTAMQRRLAAQPAR